MLEQEFLRIIDYNIFVSPEEYNEYLDGLYEFFSKNHQKDIIAVTTDIQKSLEGLIVSNKGQKQ